MVAEGRQTAGIDKRPFLGEVVAQVGQNLALTVFHVAAYPEILFQTQLLVPPDILVISDSVGASRYHLHQRVISPLVIHHGGNCRGEAKQMHVEEAGHLVERFDDMRDCVGVADNSRFPFLHIKRFDDMHIVVEHHEITEVLGHPIPLRDEADNIIGMGHYLAFGIILTINTLLTLRNANNRVVDELLGEYSIMPFVGRNHYLQAIHLFSPSNAILTSLTSTTLLLPILPVL